MATTQADRESPAFAARCLLRAARVATLATVTAGQPFASLVSPACEADGSVLMLLSELAEHTRHLRAEPRCSLLVSGAAEGANPVTAPRVTVTGLAEIVDDPALKARFVAVHPYAAMYADFGDFHLWRLRPVQALYVAGFARISRIRGSELLVEEAAVAAMAVAAGSIMDHCNTDHPDAMAAIAGRAGDWRMVGADVDGCDLSDGTMSVRVAWSAAVSEPMAVRGELVRLTRAARGG